MKGTIKRTAAIFCIWVTFFIFQGTAIGADINIGYSGPLTGPSAYVGIDALHGALIAAKEINDAGGVVVAGTKYTVNIHSYDDEGVAAKAVAGMQRLKDKYNVPVISQLVSGSVLAMLEKNEKLGVLLIGFFRHPEATNRGNKLVLRQEETITGEILNYIEGVVKILKPKSYAMLSDVGDTGKGYEAGYKPAFEKLGVKLVANEWLDMRTQTDFRGQLIKIKAAQPDVIMLSAYDEATAGAIKQAHELGIKTPFALTTGFQSMGEKLTGPALIEGYLKAIKSYNKIPASPAVARYTTQLYPAMNYKGPAAVYGMGVYEQVHTIIQAMQKAGTTTDAWKIRQAVPLTTPIDEKYNTFGVTGWKENGDAVMTGVVGRYRNGQLVEVK